MNDLRVYQTLPIFCVECRITTAHTKTDHFELCEDGFLEIGYLCPDCGHVHILLEVPDEAVS